MAKQEAKKTFKLNKYQSAPETENLSNNTSKMSDIINVDHHESVEEFKQNLEEMLPDVCIYIYT